MRPKLREYRNACIRYNNRVCFEALIYYLYQVIVFENRGKGIADFLKRREKEGSYKVFIQRHLKDDETMFRQYFRLSRNEFAFVLSATRIDLDPKPNFGPKATIFAEQKLCITLRYGHLNLFRSIINSFRA